jgi:hypothetical protein
VCDAAGPAGSRLAARLPGLTCVNARLETFDYLRCAETARLTAGLTALGTVTELCFNGEDEWRAAEVDEDGNMGDCSDVVPRSAHDVACQVALLASGVPSLQRLDIACLGRLARWPQARAQLASKQAWHALRMPICGRCSPQMRAQRA